MPHHVIAFLLLLSLVSPLAAGPLRELSRFTFEGEIPFADQISGAAHSGNVLYVTGDEDDRIEILERTGPTRFRIRPQPLRVDPCETERDFEALAVHGSSLYALGSHAAKRSRVKPDKPHRKNVERIERLEESSCTRLLIRFPLHETGPASGACLSFPIHEALAAHPVLGPFTRIPGKENGLDLEGLAFDGTRLFLGARSPVLRDGWVPVITFEESNPRQIEVLYLSLGGHGVRDLLRVEGGFLVLSGPPTEAPGPAHLDFWNGRDMLPGTDAPGGTLVRLGELAADPVSTPEALALFDDSKSSWKVLILSDGAPMGAPALYDVPRP